LCAILYAPKVGDFSFFFGVPEKSVLKVIVIVRIDWNDGNQRGPLLPKRSWPMIFL
jgi:hypothetical protein